ncbi:hypothetical protein H072_10132 [Dactylellina haptotyla CBS 200.50]|uniref:C2H2-type domain-containing protein n=1 Tax=Dactylellina haptotyla (strain CBS 200.50) TaxID=1284197 RepID=S8BME4_DACHA|nr:hypothetical protein H072_10132 [Dactylellina haptotyla CBS 200.50]
MQQTDETHHGGLLSSATLDAKDMVDTISAFENLSKSPTSLQDGNITPFKPTETLRVIEAFIASDLFTNDETFHTITIDFVDERLTHDAAYQSDWYPDREWYSKHGGEVKLDCSTALDCEFVLPARFYKIQPQHRAPKNLEKEPHTNTTRSLADMLDEFDDDPFFQQDQSAYIGDVLDAIGAPRIPATLPANIRTEDTNIGLSPDATSEPEQTDSLSHLRYFQSDSPLTALDSETRSFPSRDLASSERSSQPDYLTKQVRVVYDSQGEIAESSNNGDNNTAVIDLTQDETAAPQTSNPFVFVQIPKKASNAAGKQDANASVNIVAKEKQKKVWIACGYPGCKRRYIYEDSLLEHRATHSPLPEPEVESNPRKKRRGKK